jgi:hypothetical protein
MKQVALGLIALAMATGAHANEEPLYLGLHTASVHDIGGYENNNVGVYARYDGWTGGVFQNSNNKTSVYGAYTFELQTPRVPLIDSLALTLGLATGYPQKIQGTVVSVLFVPSAAVKIVKDVNLRVALIPAFEKVNRSTAVHFMIEMAF